MRCKEKVYKTTIDSLDHYADIFRYYVVYLNFVLGCNSLTNLKKEIKKIEKCHGVNIYSMWKDRIKKQKPVLVTHYKPRGIL